MGGGQPSPASSAYSLSPDKALAAGIYRANRYYQGTGSKEAEDRRSNGMDPRNKSGSSVDTALKKGFVKFKSPESEARFRQTAASHFYFTKLKSPPEGTRIMSARHYALLAAHDDSHPKVLRAFLPAGSTGLQRDPDSMPENLAFRTADKVDQGYVLPSKKAPISISRASEAFKDQFNSHPYRPTLHVNTVIDSATAAAMLREEQTDSETDFPGAPWLSKE
ncbi:hypothetical protein KDW41_29595 [Burkholderia vietnamiensis]|nr:hypothetical protein [Burkholderia vietnamiensis]